MRSDFTAGPSVCPLTKFMRRVSGADSASRLSATILPAFIALMIDCINLSLPLSLPSSAGFSSQCRNGVCCGRAAGGDVLREAQHARQHSDRPLGTGPLRNQDLRGNQRGCAAVLPRGEFLQHRPIYDSVTLTIPTSNCMHRYEVQILIFESLSIQCSK